MAAPEGPSCVRMAAETVHFISAAGRSRQCAPPLW